MDIIEQINVLEHDKKTNINVEKIINEHLHDRIYKKIKENSFYDFQDLKKQDLEVWYKYYEKDKIEFCFRIKTLNFMANDEFEYFKNIMLNTFNMKFIFLKINNLGEINFYFKR